MKQLGFSLRSVVLTVAAAAIVCSVPAVDPPPPIKASIHSSWAAPPLLLEILESVALENKDSYYPLLRELTSPKFLAGVSTDADIYDLSLEAITKSNHVSVAAMSTLKLSLALHSTAPWIEAHYHLYNATIVPDRLARTSDFDVGCTVWVDWYDKQICKLDDLHSAVASADIDQLKKSSARPSTMDLDRTETPKEDTGLFAIIYADIFDPTFPKFIEYLDLLQVQHGLQYSIRYIPSVSAGTKPLALSGYGVELALKSTDYIVIDDRDLGHGDQQGEQQVAFGDAHTSYDHFQNEVPVVQAVKEFALSDLGLATAQYVLKAENPLKTLVDITQDFPKYQGQISETIANQDLRQEILKNGRSVQASKTHLWLNGQPIPPHKMNPFALSRIIRREREILSQFASLDISAAKAVDLMLSASAQETTLDNDVIFDVRDKSDNKDLVVWLNDLGTDARYNLWVPSLSVLFQPAQQGQFHSIRMNLINTLFTLDMSSLSSLELIAIELPNYIKRMVPFRFGVLPLISSKTGDDAKIAMIWRHSMSRYGLKNTLDFLQGALTRHVRNGEPLMDALKSSFTATVKSATLKKTTTAPDLTFDQIFASDSPYQAWVTNVRAMTERLGLDGPSMFVNGKHFAWAEDHARNLMGEVPLQYKKTLELMQQEKVFDGVNMYDFFLSAPGVHSRRNPYVFVTEDQPLKVADLIHGQKEPYPQRLSYISKRNNEQVAQEGLANTILVVADFDRMENVRLGARVLALANREAADVRVAFVDNGKKSKDDLKSSLGLLIRQSSYEGRPLPLNFWKTLFDMRVSGKDYKESYDEAIAASPTVRKLGTEGYRNLDDETETSRKIFIKDGLKLEPGNTALVFNARIVGPFNKASEMTYEDLELLINYENKARTEIIVNTLESADIKPNAQLVQRVSSVIFGANVNQDQGLYDIQDQYLTRDNHYMGLKRTYSTFVAGDESVNINMRAPLFQFKAVLDPASESAQELAPILQMLSHMEGCHVEVTLLPVMVTKKLPINRFYRYVVEPELKFDAAGDVKAPVAHFAGLPEPTLLTLGVNVHPSWVVTSKVCIHDLDNLKLASLTGAKNRATGVEAEFELQNILVEGFARDNTQRMPPKGAQFILGTKAEPHIADTLVMANMGYFQLKANPGVWEMTLRPGKTDRVFRIESIGSEGWVKGGTDNLKRDVVVGSFEGLVLYPRLVRKPGMEAVNVLEEKDTEEDESSGVWRVIKSTFKGFTGGGSKEAKSANTELTKPKNADINIFSVASGHLYERFLSIMILSVMKNTKSTVKFWFIENFLSPSFKDYIPHMAQEYGFEFELVTYKWPHWIRAQTEKQRIIWAYKILFLDVLFPLDLDKVIFVDADQVVRTDMKELVDLDLKGAPYGYTPMCQDREEMEEFRFWNKGYWLGHLEGKPYHISALYVVDLKRFRQLQAGDRLRGHYQQLSGDPGSLANLDQDLPNNMQREVPIFSLPQEWLWCETWCGDAGLAKAKTIDLCNNPLTKEPKLDRARRQIVEWESLDNEGTALVKKVTAELRQQRLKEKGAIVLDENVIQEVMVEEDASEGVHSKKDEL